MSVAKHNRKQVLCIGSFFTANYGDRAIFHVIAKALNDQGSYRAVPFSLKPAIANKYGTAMNLITKIIIGLVVVPQHYLTLYLEARKSHAVIIGGGNLVHDVYILTMVQFLLTCLTIRAARKKYVIFCVGVGPLRSRLAKIATSISCLMAEGVIVRDTLSEKTIKACWGVNKRLRKTIVPDVVLSMSPTEKKIRRKNGPIVGISAMFYMMPGKYPNGRLREYDEYLERMEKLIRLVADQMEFRVLIFSTEPSEDQETVDTLARRVADLSQVTSTHIDSLESAFQVTASLDYHVGSRLHTLILSLAQGDVPSIALTSHPRITGLFQDLNAEDLLFDIDDFEPKTVADALKLLLGERGRMLMENVEKLRARSQKGISQVVSEIRTY